MRNFSDNGVDMGSDMDRGTGVALWRQIQQALHAEIVGGAFKPGERLPTEAEMSHRFGVNRHTLRRAVGALQDAGVLRVEQGRGTFVQEDVIDYPVARRTRFSENITRLHRHPSGELLRAAEIPAPPEIARGLKIRTGRRVALLEIVGAVDGRPVSIGAHHFPKPRFDGLIDSYRATGSITKALAQHGIGDYFRQVTRVTSRMPTPDEARHLHQAKTLPILVTENVNVDPEGRPIEFSVSRLASERVQLVFEP